MPVSKGMAADVKLYLPNNFPKHVVLNVSGKNRYGEFNETIFMCWMISLSITNQCLQDVCKIILSKSNRNLTMEI